MTTTDPTVPGAVVPPLDDSRKAALDAAIRELSEGEIRWAKTSIPQRIELLTRVHASVAAEAERWVAAATRAKNLDPDSPFVGEEWISGPYIVLSSLLTLQHSLGAIAAGTSPIADKKLSTAPGGRVSVPVLPGNAFESLLLHGFSAEVWMTPGVSEQTVRASAGLDARHPETTGGVGLVLGAGNITSIPPLDVLYELIAHNRVALLKLNPVMDRMAEPYAAAFAPLIALGVLRIVTGGGDVGGYLANHPGISHVHITGSAATHDAIVWGVGEQAAERRRRGKPLLAKPISSELGGVGPIIVVPGPWSAADLRYQAEHVATMKLHNAGCNCVAAQVLVLPREWPQRGAFLDELRRLMRELPPRAAFYPGAAGRQRAAAAAHVDAELFGGDVPRTLITGLDPVATHEHCFSSEAFGEVLAEVSLPGDDAASFLDNAVSFCNRRLAGTLGANLLVHPRTMAEAGVALDRAIADLEYGAVGVNVWNAVAFLLAQATWGAYPGHTIEDIGSGIGVVRNSFLFDRPQKTVARGPFYPFPRSWLHGDPSLLPRPPWFVTNRTAHVTARRVATIAVDPRLRRIPGIFWSALRG